MAGGRSYLIYICFLNFLSRNYEKLVLLLQKRTYLVAKALYYNYTVCMIIKLNEKLPRFVFWTLFLSGNPFWADTLARSEVPLNKDSTVLYTLQTVPRRYTCYFLWQNAVNTVVLVQQRPRLRRRFCVAIVYVQYITWFYWIILMASLSKIEHVLFISKHQQMNLSLKLIWKK